jgi:hypothetical protein
MVATEDGDGFENENEDEDEEENEEEGPESARTPTKRRTYSSGVDRGVDLQAGPSSASTSASASRRSARRQGDTSAFFALRPGSGHSGSGIGITLQNHRGRGRDRSISPTPEKRGVLAPRRNLKEVRERRVLGKRRDWRYPEVVWAGRSVRQENEKYLDKVRDDWPCVAVTVLR